MRQTRMAARLRNLMARLLGPSNGSPAPTPETLPEQNQMAPPTVTWPSGDGAQRYSLACPNCGSDAPKPLLLAIEFTTSPGSRKHTTVLRCPDCTCPFYAAQIPPDYAEAA